MGYSWVYVGDGRVPASDLDAWLDESTEVEFEWPEDWEMEGSTDVADTLESLADEDASEVDWDEGVIRVRTLADKSGDAWLTYRGDLAIAFRLLAKYRGQGALVILGFDDGPDEGIRIEVRADGTSSCVSLSADEIRAVRESKAYQEVVAIRTTSPTPG